MAKKRISGKHIKWLNFGIFFGSCLFVCGFAFEETCKILKRKRIYNWLEAFESTKNNWGNNCVGYTSRRTPSDGKEYFILVLKKRFNFSDEDHRMLAHEVLHLASFNIAESLDPMVENEAFAYLHTHLMKQCHDILRS